MPTTTMPGATTTSTTDALWRVTLVTLHSILWLRDAVSWSVSWLWLGLSYALKHKGVKLDCISTDVKALKKVPHHLALVVQERCVSCEDLARAMTWAFASDIRLVSIYDPYGNVLKDLTCLRSKVQSSHQQLFNSPLPDIQVCTSQEAAAAAASPAQDGGYRVVVLSPEDGRHTVVQSAVELCRLVLERGVQVDTDMLHNRIAGSVGLPDPELAIVFGQACSTVGYPPWQLRLTEIHNISSHHKLSYQQFLRVLQSYSECQQRGGK